MAAHTLYFKIIFYDEAATAREVLEKIGSLPDLAILDLHLPDLSGFELCRKIKEDPRTSSVSVLQSQPRS